MVVTKIGSGNFVLSGTNTYSGGTTINGGTLQIGNGGTTGSIAGDVLNNATLGFNRSDAMTFDGVISGSGAVQQLGIGTTTLTGTNTYSGGTTISAGTLQLGNGGTTGSIAGDVLNNATLAFNRSDAMSFDGVISGNGAVQQFGTGTTTLTGTNTYTGGTTISAGTLQIGNGGTTGSIAGDVLNNAMLAFNRSDAMGFDGVISGSGSLWQVGTGTVTLTGTSTYTGATTVNGGTLAVNGSIVSSSLVTVNSGGTLGGTGTVPSTVINSGGMLAPGNSIGTINVSGDLTFNGGAVYWVEVSPSASDRTNVTGIATLAGTVAASFQLGSYITKQYTIVNATGGRSGTFDSLVTGSLPDNFTASLSYDANNAYLDLVLNYVAPSAPDFGSGLNENQQTVAGALTNYFNTAGGIPTVFGMLTPDGLTQVSGQSGAGIVQNAFDASNQFINLMFDPANVGGLGGSGPGERGPTAFADTALGYAPNKKAAAADALAALDRQTPEVVRRWNLWAAGYGGNNTISGNATTGTNTTTSRVYGTAAGASYRLAPDTLVGFALGGAGTSYGLDGGLGGGHADLFQAGAFVRHTVGAAYAVAGLAYGWQDVSTDRTVSVSGTSRLEANFAASTFAARGEAGYRFAVAQAGVTPYVALQSSTFHSPSYSETATSGSDQFALTYGSQTTTDIRTELGLRTVTTLSMLDGALTLRGRAVWAHDGNTNRLATATFETLPGATFTVSGAQPAADAALVSLGAELGWKNGWSLAGNFDGEFSTTTRGYAGRGILRREW